QTALRQAALSALLIMVMPSASRADAVDDLAQKLVNLDASARELEQGIHSSPTHDASRTERRFIDAKVAFGMKNWSDASIMLYDLAENHSESRNWKEAVFLLAESLYQEQNYLSSRLWFHKIVEDFGERSPYYQQALQRLVELSLVLGDTTDV